MPLSPGPRARKIGRELLLMIVEDAGGLALVADEGAVDISILHELDDRVPAGLIESVLEDEACGMTKTRPSRDEQKSRPPGDV
jgi:hypothetical protein